jgi:glycosyltransferase involved in cell wall biosynthesis
MKILVIALLKPSQIKHKIIPLSKSKYIKEIILIRKVEGPKVDKVSYIVLPHICKHTFFYLLLTPLYVIYFSLTKKVDLILSYHFIPHGFFAFLGHVFTRRPYIYSQIDLDIQFYLQKPLLRGIILKILKRAKFIFVPGSSSFRFWIDKGFDKSKIHIIHSTIDTDFAFFPTGEQKEFDFIYIGVLDKNKQVDLIIKSFGSLLGQNASLRMCILGDGKERLNLQKIVTDLGIFQNIFFIGQENEVNHYLNRSKVFVMASKAEGLPCALMEAMSCELIPVVTNVGNISDIVRDGETGFLVENQSLEELAGKMKMALFHYNDSSNIMKNARKIIVEHHSYYSATQEWNNVLKSLEN